MELEGSGLQIKWRRVLVLGLVVMLLALVVWAAFIFRSKNNSASPSSQENLNYGIGSNSVDSEATAAGKRISGSQTCEGEGVTKKLSASPMDASDFTIVIPYGLMVGAHVTPIDHQYFSPAAYNSPVDAYPVYAMGDATIVNIGTRNNASMGSTEYRIVFSVSCTLYYYYDLVTGLAPDIKAQFDAAENGGYAQVEIPVTAGQPVGRIGGRTLDFAVWDTTKPLTGFVVPEHYDGEAWKLYTADPLDYYTDELKEFIISRYVRTTEPRSGKIDYDIDGRLIGNWFLEGSGGYAPVNGYRENYFTSHLAIAPDHFDPSRFIVSVGSLYSSTEQGNKMQYAIADSTAQPAEVTAKSGLVKYNLSDWQYVKDDGSFWDRNSLVKGVKLITDDLEVTGCALAELVEERELKFELVTGKNCDLVTGFSEDFSIYKR